jgi:hypothetical protein
VVNGARTSNQIILCAEIIAFVVYSSSGYFTKTNRCRIECWKLRYSCKNTRASRESGFILHHGKPHVTVAIPQPPTSSSFLSTTSTNRNHPRLPRDLCLPEPLPLLLRTLVFYGWCVLAVSSDGDPSCHSPRRNASYVLA